MIDVRNLSKHYPHLKAVDDLSFSVQPGEVLGFLGPNGAGKTTTMRMLAGFITPSTGDALIYGHSVCDQPLAVKQRIGYLPEGVALHNDMTPLGFLKFVVAVRGIAKQQRNAAIERVVDTLELSDVLHQPIGSLSKGFRGRVGLAQAIVHDPDILILDEPTDGLDPNQKHTVRQLINKLASNKIIVVSTHILEEVNAVCSRVIIISDGRLCADDTPEALGRLSRHHNAVTLCFGTETANEQLQHIANTIARSGIAIAVETNIKNLSVTAFAKDGTRIIDAINRLVRQHQWLPEQCRVESGRLDDVFRAVTQP